MSAPGLNANTDHIEVYDGDGNRKTMDWLVEKYGNIFYSRAPEHGRAFRIYRIQENTSGQSSVKVDVRNEDGEPNDNNACFYWEGAPHQQHGCQTQPFDNFIVQGTGKDGLTDFAMGHGAYYTPDHNDAYHKIWICSSIPSDVVNAGMLANTNHHHVDYWYGIGEGTAPPVDPPTDPPTDPPIDLPGDLAGKLDAILGEVLRIGKHFT